LIADFTGTTVWRWDQGEPFGNDVPNNNPQGAGAFDFPLRFPGQSFDRETNLNYNMRRDYNQSIGRYVESDPIGLRAGLNTYAYVSNKPLIAKDPLASLSGLVL
jgi:RHS repeat-associated protein